MIFHSFLASGISDYFSVFEYYFGKFSSNVIEPVVWVEFTLSLLIGFAIRGYYLIKFELGRINKRDKISIKKMSIYCAGHIAYEFIIGYIITYCLINFTNANPHAPLINILICPGIGFIAGYIFDIKILMKLEQGNPVANIDKEIEISNKKREQAEEQEKDTDDTKIKKIDIDDIQSCDIELTFDIISTLNEIIDKDNDTDIMISDLKSKIEILENAISILKETERKETMLEVKSLMYKCLNKHFATPDENDIIVAKYNAYKVLVDHDDEMTALYNKYCQLNVHDDRRKQNIPVENDRRRPKKEIYKIDDEI